MYELLDDSSYVTMNGTQYLQVNTVAPPCFIGADQGTRSGTAYEYSINLYAKVEKK